MAVALSIDTAPFYVKLQETHQKFSLAMDKLIKLRAPTVISSTGKVPGLIQVTPPFGQGKRGKAAKEQGENAVVRDISKVYRLTSSVYNEVVSKNKNLAKAYWFAVKKGDSAMQLRILRAAGIVPEVAMDFDPSHHRNSRDSRGRVRTTQSYRQIVTDVQPFLNYVDQKKAMVGTLASFMNRSARAYNAKGVPVWVARHGGFDAAPQWKSLPNGSVIVFNSSPPFGGGDQARRSQYVVQYRLKALEREAMTILRKVSKTIA